MERKDNKDEDKKKKKHPILDTLEEDIAHAYAILNNLKLCIEYNDGCRTTACVRCHIELERANKQIEILISQNDWLRQKNRELKLHNEELLRYRTPDAYMDAVATALALFPISSANKAYEETGIQYTTIKKAADILGLVATKEARDEARQRMKEVGLNDIERRGGQNRKAVEMLVNGKVVATFDSASDAGRATSSKNTILDRIKSGSIIDGVQFRYKKNQ